MTTSEELRTPKTTIQGRLATALHEAKVGCEPICSEGQKYPDRSEGMRLSAEAISAECHLMDATELLASPSLKALLDVVDAAEKWLMADPANVVHQHNALVDAVADWMVRVAPEEAT